MEIFKSFTFDSAHFLPKVPEHHPCKNMHGHTYKAILYFKGQPDPELGWIIDFGDIKQVVKPLIDKLDHQVLNDVEGLENPTCENITIWIYNRVKAAVPSLSRVVLHETPTSGAEYP